MGRKRKNHFKNNNNQYILIDTLYWIDAFCEGSIDVKEVLMRHLNNAKKHPQIVILIPQIIFGEIVVKSIEKFGSSGILPLLDIIQKYRQKGRQKHRKDDENMVLDFPTVTLDVHEIATEILSKYDEKHIKATDLYFVSIGLYYAERHSGHVTIFTSDSAILKDFADERGSIRRYLDDHEISDSVEIMELR